MIHARKDYDRIQDPENLIKEDEPVFLIRAKDSLAPYILEAYANYAELIGCEPHMINSVREHANRVRAWQYENESKTPDMPYDSVKY